MIDCIDSAERDRLASAPNGAVGAFDAHLARCEGCRDAVAVLALADAPVHPSGEALAAFAADPRFLPPRAAAYVDAHLAACAPCRSLLEAVPEEAPIALGRRSFTPRLLFAAAGWIVAAFILVRSTDRRPEATPLVEAVQTIVLQATRGEAGAPVDRTASILRFKLVTDEEIATGATLELVFYDGADHELLKETAVVREKDEHDWPVLTVSARRLPDGIVRLEVLLPSSKKVSYPLGGR